MIGWLRDWRRRRVIRRQLLADGDWRCVLDLSPRIAGLDNQRRQRLRELVTLFLHDKDFYGAQGLELDREIRFTIAAFACLPVLDLGYDYLDGWWTIVVYPAAFRVRHRRRDEHGVVSEHVGELSGEAWHGGPLVFSWEDIEYGRLHPDDGENVVIHEIAHKLDMRNGDANGHPPLPRGMSRAAWARAFGDAYGELTDELERGREPEIDPYAATDPGEFFAVVSEYYFEAPGHLRACMPGVYEQLQRFYGS